MDPFWNNIYDDTKDKRYGGLFIGVLLFLFVGLPLLGWGLSYAWVFLPNFIGIPDPGKFMAVCLVLAGALCLVATALYWRRRIRFGRKIREDRSKYSNLSRDELMKARSKLKNNMNPVKFRAVERPGKRPVLRAPDTDLKY